MNRLLLLALAASVGLSACAKKDEAAPAAASTAAPAPAAQPAAGPVSPPTQSAATPHVGKVLQALQAGSYTYVEVETDGGTKAWIAGAALQVKAGDRIQWGDSAVMQNFESKTLNRKFDQIMFVQTWGPVGGSIANVAPHGSQAGTPAAAPGHPPMAAQGAMPGHPPMAAPAANAGQPAAPAGNTKGEVKSVINASGYSYLEIKQGSGTLWLAAPETSAKAGDKVVWQEGMVMRNFTAKSLGRTFEQITFTDRVTVAN